MTVKSFPQKNISPVTYTYKVKDTIHLDLHIYYPKKMKRNATIPAVIFFFGGGWANGNTGQFMSHSKFLAENGIAGITAEYRIKNIHGTTPQDAISDAKSAMRWLKSNAEGIQQPEVILQPAPQRWKDLMIPLMTPVLIPHRQD
jgi:acetyl esterase/lipase